MASVPAVEGRLLRFGGDRLHAVPRPHDVYWTFDQSESNIHTPDYLRSVLLFNLWNHSAAPLIDKVLDCGDGAYPKDRTTCREGDGRWDGPRAPLSSSPGAACRPRDEWRDIPFVYERNAPKEERQGASWSSLLLEWLFGSSLQKEAFQVPLSGDAHKRGISGYVARMQSGSWWGIDNNGEDQRWVHPARDMLGKAFLPSVTEIEPDERFVIAPMPEREL